jgi:hypothetical protein
VNSGVSVCSRIAHGDRPWEITDRTKEPDIFCISSDHFSPESRLTRQRSDGFCQAKVSHSMSALEVSPMPFLMTARSMRQCNQTNQALCRRAKWRLKLRPNQEPVFLTCAGNTQSEFNATLGNSFHWQASGLAPILSLHHDESKSGPLTKSSRISSKTGPVTIHGQKQSNPDFSLEQYLKFSILKFIFHREIGSKFSF